MSGASEDKHEPGKALPLDLAAKLASVKTVDVKTPLIMPGPQTIRGMRVLTTTPGQGGTVTGSTIIMPSQVLKAAGHQITGIINAGQGGGTALPTNITIQRPAQITLATNLPVVTSQASPQGGATYHVPRGPAVVATLSAPRSSNVGATIRTPLVVRDGSVLSTTSLSLGCQQQQQGNPLPATNVGIQQFTVGPTRTPSPAQNPGTGAWLTTVTPNAAIIAAGNGAVQQYQHGKSTIQQQQILTPIRSTSVSATGSLGGASITSAGLTPKGATAIVPAGLVVTRTQPGQQQQISSGQTHAVSTTLATIRPTIFQPGSTGTHIPIAGQLHAFKSAPGSGSSHGQSGNITTIASSVSIAQVLPNRTQTLVYSDGGSTASGNLPQAPHSYNSAPRLAIGTPTVPFRQTPTPRSVVTATRLTMAVGSQSGVQAGARVLAAPPPGTTVLTSTGVRISSVSTVSHQGHQQHQNHPLATIGGATLATRGLTTTTTTSTPSLSNITAIGQVVALPTSLGGGATLTPASSMSMGGLGGGGRLSTVTVASPGSVASLSLTNHAQSQMLSTGGGSHNIRSHTLNLHNLPLVAVTSTPPHHGLSGTGGASIGLKSLPHQSGAIHLSSMPSTIKAVQNIVTTTARTSVNTNKVGIVAQRQASMVTTQTIPIGKVYPQQGEPGLTQSNVCIHTSVPSAPKRASPGLLSISTEMLSASAPALAYSITDTLLLRSGGDPSGQAMLQASGGAFTLSSVTLPTVRPCIYTQQIHATLAQQQQPPPKLTSSPRPSILRKRDNDGSPLKAAKNLTSTLNSTQQQMQHLLLQQQQHQQQLQQLTMESPRSPHLRPDSRNNGNSSEGGSTTISASSSPGLGDTNDDMVSMPINIIKGEEENRPPPEMSPRKKPRKQNLAGNDFDDHRHDDMQFLNDHRDVKKELSSHQQVHMDHQTSLLDHETLTAQFNNSQQQQQFNQITAVKQEDSPTGQLQSQQQRSGGKMATERVASRKPQASLLNSYRQTWKTTNNHYLRYSDVKPKDERRPSIMDLSNQYRVLDKANGWKIHHLSTQMEDLADQEQAVYNQLTELLKYTESREWNSYDKDVNRINELIKGNLQRIKIINDGMIEAKAQIMKIFDHKTHVIDIISRCASKRNYKKREKV